MDVGGKRIQFGDPTARQLIPSRRTSIVPVLDDRNIKHLLEVIEGVWHESAMTEGPSSDNNAFAVLVYFSITRYYFGLGHHPDSSIAFSVTENGDDMDIGDVILRIDQCLRKLGFFVVRR
jgi:hypothetical protein